MVRSVRTLRIRGEADMTGRPDTVRALVFTGPRSLEFRQIEVPGPAADGALLAVMADEGSEPPPVHTVLVP